MYFSVLGVALSGLFFSLVWPRRAQAFDGEPLCAMRSPDDGLALDDELAHEALLDPRLECAPDGVEHVDARPWSAPISVAEAREALAHADELITLDRLDDALIALRVVEHAMPRIADRIALRKADILMRVGRPAEACQAYAIAQASPERNVAAQARIAMVRCMLEAGEHGGESELDRILARYPNMGERSELRLELARAREAWNNPEGAVAIYRAIDLSEPESSAAASSREAMARLRAAGVNVHPYSPLERVERAEKLFQRGPIDAAHDATAELFTSDLVPPLLGRAHLLAAKIARIEGRFEIVRDEVQLAMKLGTPAGDALRLLPRGPGSTAEIEPAARSAEGEARIKRVLGVKPIAKAQTAQLRGLLDIAVQFQLRDRATEILETMRARTSLQPAVRFEAAILSSGLAADQAVADLLEGVAASPKFALAGRYHHARALERMGRFGEAEADYLRVIQDDTISPRYYAMWSDLRLWSMRSEQKQSCQPDGNMAIQAAAGGSAAPVDGVIDAAVTGVLEALPQAGRDARAVANAALAAADAGEAEPASSQLASTGDDQDDPESNDDGEVDLAQKAKQAELAAARAARRERVLAVLAKVADDYGAAYPWLPRAVDLVELELFDDAADEIGEAYLAWRDARGELRLRSGLEAVLTGSAPARHPMDNALRNARRSIDEGSRQALANAADMLGDPGVSLYLRQVRGEMRPRAYSEEVERAAAKYGIDPNLLFAVMRVESIYHRQIVSYAGAVGLMQIMPRTGMLIAKKLGVEGFDVSNLLDPSTNVEFAAWYLSSLIKRFDGRIPLAIAAYNGGPHNVRVWMRENPPDMPLDAFLERIPFEQTHRYVRRVLTHMAAYRAQQNLPMTRLDVTLPGARPDAMAF